MDLLLDTLLLLGLAQLSAAVLLALGLPLVLGLLLALILGLLEWVLTDLLVGISVQFLKTVGFQVIVNVLVELTLVTLLIVICEGFHVLGDVTTEDVSAEGVGIELLGFDIVTWESGLGVGDEKTTVGGTLHDSEDTSTSGGTMKTDIKENLEWSSFTIVGLSSLGQLVFTIGFLNTLEVLIELELLQDTTSAEETSGVSSGPVGKTILDTVTSELVGVSSAEDLVAGQLGADDLDDDVAVGESDDKSVLWRVVLVLGLRHKSLAGIVVGFTLSSTPWLGLEAAVVSAVLNELGERHLD